MSALQELESFSKKVNVLQQSQEGFSGELYGRMVAELVSQFEVLSTSYHAHSQAEDQIVSLQSLRSAYLPLVIRPLLLSQVFPMLQTKVSGENQKACSLCSDEHEVRRAADRLSRQR